MTRLLGLEFLESMAPRHLKFMVLWVALQLLLLQVSSGHTLSVS
uniref:Phosphatidylinositol n-acetylglucosaminyltransferase subunit p n=1 Tax=Rhizophora mucronata TaxID=61149 RepID=A0A2P2JJR9_RHIMU